MNRRWLEYVAASSLCAVALAGRAEPEPFHAMITTHGGQKSSVRDIRVVYSWREMPADREGLVPYKLRDKIEQGLWVAEGPDGTTGFRLIPFGELDAIEFQTSLVQLGVSETYDFRIEQIVLHRTDGTREQFGKELLDSGHPVLWPGNPKRKFPEDLGGQRADRISVMLHARSRIEGEDSRYLFVFPRPVTTAFHSTVRKQRDAFPQWIHLSRSDAAPQTARAGE
jgi:hypothetical protein